MTGPTSKIQTVVFDLGGVLVDWNPRYLYRKLIKDEAAMEKFLTTVTPQEWNERQDAGRPFSEAIAEITPKFPEHAELIHAYFARWPEMLGGAIDGTVQVLEELHSRGEQKLFALSNWSAETFPFAIERFPFLKLFQKVLLSGEEKLIKPDPRFFRLLEERHQVKPAQAVFIDDVQKNIDAARALGYNAIHFTDPASLRQKLSELGIVLES